MIQRKQTLFLIFAILLMVGYIFSPVLHIEGSGLKYDVFAKEVSINVGFPVIGHYFVFVCLIAAIVASCICLLTIALYKWRKVQILFCWLSLIPALYCFGYVYYRFSTTELIQDQWFWYGNISPLVAILFIFAAMISIRADEELVKSVDRLR